MWQTAAILIKSDKSNPVDVSVDEAIRNRICSCKQIVYLKMLVQFYS